MYVNYGTDKDFEEIKRMNISLKGKIVICRYGKNFRGDKVRFTYEVFSIQCFAVADYAVSTISWNRVSSSGFFNSITKLQILLRGLDFSTIDKFNLGITGVCSKTL